MSYLSRLTEEEVSYVCARIPTKNIVSYCQQHPKSFAKIMPGFRPRAIAKYGSDKFLFRNRNQGFITSFIDGHIKEWLDQVDENIEKSVEKGVNEELALLCALQVSSFVDNVPLYFKLKEEEKPESYILLLSATVKELKEIDAEKKSLESDVHALRQELESSTAQLDKTKEKLSNLVAEIRILKSSVSEVKKLNAVIHQRDVEVASQQARIQTLEDQIRKLKAELAAARITQRELEDRVVVKLQEQRKRLDLVSQPKAPKDEMEFKEHLAYNLESIGIPRDKGYFSLLIDHLNSILFKGLPVIVSRSTGIMLMKCIANTLLGQTCFDRLTYRDSLSISDVEVFLSQAGRIACLDNFIGNWNETLLLPLFERFKDKIIFLTAAYDRTLYFVPFEFLKYCVYLNLNRISALTVDRDLTEPPSVIEEEVIVDSVKSPDGRYQALLKGIMRDFGFNQAVAEHRSLYMSDEQGLCRMLAFEVLPYVRDVLQLEPYNMSERFIRYAGDSGRCPYKDLFRLWFA